MKERINGMKKEKESKEKRTKLRKRHIAAVGFQIQSVRNKSKLHSENFKTIPIFVIINISLKYSTRWQHISFSR